MAGKPVVYATRQIPEHGIDLLEEKYDVVAWDGTSPPSKKHIEEQLSELEADALLCLLTDDIDGEVMDSSPNLKVVSTFSVGYDHIDIEAAEQRDIAVGHTPGVLTDTTADYTWALLMTCARRTVEGHEHVVDSQWESWQPTLLTGPDVHESTLGIVGLGSIGTAVARRAGGFNMEILYSDAERKPDIEEKLREEDINVTYVEQEIVFEESDFITLHVPLFEATRHLVGENELKTMKESAILINTSRGPVVNADALTKALEQDWIFSAGLDVTDPEPLPDDHSLMEHIPHKLVVTPHIASASIQTRNKMAEMAAKNIDAALSGMNLPTSAIEDNHKQG